MFNNLWIYNIKWLVSDIFNIKIDTSLTEDEIIEEYTWIEWVDFPNGGIEQSKYEIKVNTITIVSYEKINPLDDIKVIKEEWFKNLN
jgi:hypothetical protein